EWSARCHAAAAPRSAQSATPLSRHDPCNSPASRQPPQLPPEFFPPVHFPATMTISGERSFKGDASLRGLQITLKECADILFKAVVQNRAAHGFYVTNQKANIMDAQEIMPQQFARFHQMAQVSARELLAAHTVTFGIQWTLVAGKLRSPDVEIAVGREDRTVPRQTSWQHAVEDVHAAQDCLRQIIGRSYAHQITGLVFRQHGNAVVERLVHLGFALPHSQPANRVAGKSERGEECRRLLAQVRKHASLLNTKQRLHRIVRMCSAAASRPRASAGDGGFHDRATRRRRTQVEAHDNIRAEIFLYL